ncbi:MAG: dihydroorotate dehydrogenase electron transfer subunit [Candidatus Micrarchaeota archaeon]|nr:dihydroorotate dehydrogenase electron transfer subunit [Candidatus Micrarchaeota archaeon]
MELDPGKPTFEMQTCKVLSVKKENYRVKTFEIDSKIKAKPGQYIMVWVPNVGERPMSLGGTNPIRLSIANIGKFSNAIHELKEGNVLSFRGPLGTSFKLPKPKAETTKHEINETQNSGLGTILLVGGGYGVVPLYFLAKEAKKIGIKSTVIIAARKADDIIYENNFKELGCEVLITTDDGSEGFKGNAVEGVKHLISQGKKFDEAYSCGPEMMMYYLALYCKEKNVPCQVSVERYMKCGINICGACAVDGKLCCSDGPIFTGNKALSFAEFGKVQRDASGKKIEGH